MNNSIQTTPVSDCCNVLVYPDFVGPDIIEKLKEFGLEPIKDFPVFIETDFCSGCERPCQVIYKPSV